MRRVQEVGEEEADKLEGHGYHRIPDKREDGAHGEAIDEYFIRDHSGSENGGFPVRGSGVRGRLLVRLRVDFISPNPQRFADDLRKISKSTYRRLLLVLLPPTWLGAQIREHTVIATTTVNPPPAGRLRSKHRQLRHASLYVLPLRSTAILSIALATVTFL